MKVHMVCSCTAEIDIDCEFDGALNETIMAFLRMWVQMHDPHGGWIGAGDQVPEVARLAALSDEPLWTYGDSIEGPEAAS